jgi:hypothetical protein
LLRPRRLARLQRLQQHPRLGAVAPAQLLEDRGDVRLDRALLDHQAVGDLPVEQAFGEQRQHAMPLPGETGQAAGEGGVGRVGGQGGNGRLMHGACGQVLAGGLSRRGAEQRTVAGDQQRGHVVELRGPARWHRDRKVMQRAAPARTGIGLSHHGEALPACYGAATIRRARCLLRGWRP